MGFSIGGGGGRISCPLGNPLLQSTHSHSITFFNAQTSSKLSKNSNKIPPPVMAQFQDNRSVMYRRSFLLMGISAFPLLEQLRAIASSEDAAAKGEKGSQGGGSLSSVLNAIGVIGSGVLGALYAVSQKEKTAIQSSITSMDSKLGEKEVAIRALESMYEDKMFDEKEDHRKQIAKLVEKEATFSNQLAAASVTIKRLGKEMLREKSLVESLSIQLDELRESDDRKKILEAEFEEKLDEIRFLHDRITLLEHEAQDQKAHMEQLDVSLSMKKLECEKVNSAFDRTKTDCENARADVQKLTLELIETSVELKSKNDLIDELNKHIDSLLVEKDSMHKEVCVLQADNNSLRLMSARKTQELQKLEQKMNNVLDEAEKNNQLISSLKKEKDDFEAKFLYEIKSTETLQNELTITQHNLRDSSLQVAELSTKLQESKMTCEELVSEISRAQNEFIASQKASLQLSDQLAYVKDLLEETKQELLTKSAELKAIIEASESLKKKLLDTYKKTETTAQALKEERKEVAKLKMELTASGDQIIKDTEIIATLVKDLDEAKTKATSSSQEMTADSLKEEKELIYKVLVEQRSITKEAKENIEDAQSLIIQLGTEKENLQRRCMKLEQDLASAKGEILRLRQLGSSKKA
ncbi:hypothetical protein ZOSMA_98G00320 [Zostera marina]|uniref:MAR-binding filament-like protein 1-1 n=1 Tax=Zostera marina TaxID=29655 RepID=A0A0K9NHW3_ZOSMR|nr:hypothetical protein ZOSMA_98G00320 [Zostera marina]